VRGPSSKKKSGPAPREGAGAVKDCSGTLHRKAIRRDPTPLNHQFVYYGVRYWTSLIGKTRTEFRTNVILDRQSAAAERGEEAAWAISLSCAIGAGGLGEVLRGGLAPMKKKRPARLVAEGTAPLVLQNYH